MHYNACWWQIEFPNAVFYIALELSLNINVILTTIILYLYNYIYNNNIICKINQISSYLLI